MTGKNPKRSGGPQTPEGKVASSQNSIKTGTYSSLVVLPSEDQEEFNALLDQFNRDFHPVDVIEISLVSELATLTWKKLRLQKLEQSQLIMILESPIKMDELKAEGIQLLDDVYKLWINGDIDDLKLIESYKKAISRISVLLGQRMLSLQDLLSLKDEHPFVYESIITNYKNNFPQIYEDIDLEDVIYKMIKEPNQPENFFVTVVLKRVMAFCKNAVWVFDHRDAVDQAVSNIKQKRLIKAFETEGLRRANDDTTRSLMRVLGEFRKHSEWRMKHRVIDAEE